MKSKRKKVRGVYEKAPGSGVWWIRYADASGKIRREKVGPKGAACQLYQKRKTDVRLGKKLPENLRRKKVTFAELAQDTLYYSRQEKQRSYKDVVSRMKKLTPRFGNFVAESITKHDVDLFLREGIERGWSPATANRYRALLSLVFRLGIDARKVAENPAKLVKHRKENNARTRYLTPEEEVSLRQVLQQAYPERMPELDLALNTGMRKSEMYGLKWDTIQLGQKMLTIQTSKNGEMRHIPLNKGAIEALMAFRERANGTGPVVRNLMGESIHSNKHWFGKAVEEAGIADFTWHCLRHTFASRLAMCGASLRAIQELMGHRDINMTVRYAHLSPDFQLGVVERLEQFGKPGHPVGTTDTITSTAPLPGEKASPPYAENSPQM